jgi:hypothetical protein
MGNLKTTASWKIHESSTLCTCRDMANYTGGAGGRGLDNEFICRYMANYTGGAGGED